MSLESILDLLARPLFVLGATPVTLLGLLGLLAILVSVWWLASTLEHWVGRLALRGGAWSPDSASVYAWLRIIRYLVWIIGTLVGLSYVGVDLTSLALVGGAIGVGIGFGLQNIFSNLISGIIILLERTLKVGDFVDLQSGVRGNVREIGLRYTRVTTNDDVDIIVPNAEFINGRVTNWTLDNRIHRVRIRFGVAYGSEKEAVREAGLRAAAKVPATIELPGRKTSVWLTGFGDNSLDFQLAVWVGPEYVARPSATEASYMWALHDELTQAGIEIPFPQRDLHVRSGTLDVRVHGEATSS